MMSAFRCAKCMSRASLNSWKLVWLDLVSSKATKSNSIPFSAHSSNSVRPCVGSVHIFQLHYIFYMHTYIAYVTKHFLTGSENLDVLPADHSRAVVEQCKLQLCLTNCWTALENILVPSILDWWLVTLKDKDILMNTGWPYVMVICGMRTNKTITD
jgi:hypothetical protein